jgi:hypothetical protein
MAKKATQLVHVRMPKDLHRKLQRDAERCGVTLNAEILLLLDRAFELRGFADAINTKIQEVLDHIGDIGESESEPVGATKAPKTPVGTWYLTPTSAAAEESRYATLTREAAEKSRRATAKYLHRAAECRDLARTTASPNDRAELEKMALIWEKLAGHLNPSRA